MNNFQQYVLKISQHIMTNQGMGYLVLTVNRLVLFCFVLFELSDGLPN